MDWRECYSTEYSVLWVYCIQNTGEENSNFRPSPSFAPFPFFFSFLPDRWRAEPPTISGTDVLTQLALVIGHHSRRKSAHPMDPQNNQQNRYWCSSEADTSGPSGHETQPFGNWPLGWWVDGSLVLWLMSRHRRGDWPTHIHPLSSFSLTHCGTLTGRRRGMRIWFRPVPATRETGHGSDSRIKAKLENWLECGSVCSCVPGTKHHNSVFPSFSLVGGSGLGPFLSP